MKGACIEIEETTNEEFIWQDQTCLKVTTIQTTNLFPDSTNVAKVESSDTSSQV